MIDDNDKKIKYLAALLEKYLSLQDIKVRMKVTQKIESIKRLPWTR